MCWFRLVLASLSHQCARPTVATVPMPSLRGPVPGTHTTVKLPDQLYPLFLADALINN